MPTTAPFQMNSMSFLFRIDHIRPDFNRQPLQRYNDGDWMPPTWAVGLRTTETGDLYRWRGGSASVLPGDDQAFQMIFQNPTLYQHSATTVFTQCPSQSLFAVEFDARYKNVAEADYPWTRMMFDHKPHPAGQNLYYSELGLMRDQEQMASGTNTVWQQALFPSHMHCDVNDTDVWNRRNGGLIGELGCLLAVIAFSGKQDYIDHILQHCLLPPQHPAHLGRWASFPNQVHGSKLWNRIRGIVSAVLTYLSGTRHRGVVVTIFKDPSAPAPCQTPQSFTSLETGRFGAFLV